MSLKLPLFILTMAVAGGSLFTTVQDRGPVPVNALSAPDGAAQRQGRISGAPPLVEPSHVAEQVRTAQLKEPNEAVPAQNMPFDEFDVVEAQQPSQQQPAEPPSGEARAPSQARQQNNGQSSPVAAPPTASPPGPDLTALRYFAAQGDTARLQAEIARLRSLYPNWTPPADPLAVPTGRDEQLDQMWKFYADGKYAEVRKAIADRQASDPRWQPPQDLLDRVNVAETRTRLITASELKQYETVIDLASQTPSLRNCSDVDVLWRLGEAFIQTKRQDRGEAVYRYILTNCSDPEQRLATVQKASTLLPPEALAPLLSLERGDEFASVRDDLARNRVAQANKKPGSAVPPDDLARLKAIAERDGKATDALLLGWYALRHDDMNEAMKWFSAARGLEDSSSASQGLALAMISLDKAGEAENVMYKWRNDSEEASATYLATTANLMAEDPPPLLSEEVLRRIAETVIEKKYVPTAQQFGWYARALNQPQTALRWFQTALGWKPDDEPSAYGLAVTRQQLNDRAGVAEIQRLWAGRSARIANLGLVTPPMASARVVRPGGQLVQQQPQQSVVPSDSVRPPETTATPRQVRLVRADKAGSASRVSCSSYADPAELPPAAALARGWCLMDLKRPLEAVRAFEIALRSDNIRVKQDAAYGESLAYLRLGLTSKAAVAAAKAPQRPERSAELQIAILADRANAAFNSERYREALVYLDQRSTLQPETSDLLVLRAYALMKLGRPDDALRIFELVAETGNRAASRGLQEARIALGLDRN